MKTTGLGMLVALALGTAPATAQPPRTPAPGDPVRVTYRLDDGAGPPIATVQGFWNDLNSERLRLTLRDNGSQYQDVPTARLIRLEARGRSRAVGAGKGALWGGIIGAGSGAGLLAWWCADPEEGCTTGGSVWALVVFAAIGSGAGALIGTATGAQEWQTMAITPATPAN